MTESFETARARLLAEREKRDRENDFMWCGICNERVHKLPEKREGTIWSDCACLRELRESPEEG